MKPASEFQRKLHMALDRRLDWHYENEVQPETDSGDVLVHIHIGTSTGVKWSCRRRYVDFGQVIPLLLKCRSLARLIGYRNHVTITTHHLKHHDEWYEVFVTYVV